MEKQIHLNPFRHFSVKNISFSQINLTEILDISAALAFYISLSLSPLIVLIVASLKMISPDLQDKFIEQVQLLTGSGGAEVLLQLMKSHTDQATVVASQIAGLVTLLISCGAIFGHLRQSFDKIFYPNKFTEGNTDSGFARATFKFLKEQVFQIGLVVSFILILVISLLVSSFLIYLTRSFVISSFYNFSVTVLSLVVFAFYFFLLFYFIPSQRISVRVATMGGIVTAFLFMIGKSLIGLYIGHSGLGSSLGAAGTIVVIMAWIYYSSLVIFMCAKLVSMAALKEDAKVLT